MSFILNSAPNEASPQFTLTCISTGGPATTVTWTRGDSEVVTTGNMTQLNNTETTQYIHTLSMTGRLGGLYTCIVENNKPSSDSAQLDVNGMKLSPFGCKVIILSLKFYSCQPSHGFDCHY